MLNFEKTLQQLQTWNQGIYVIATVGILLLASACVTVEEVETEIEEANYCENADECVEIIPGCPFGCWDFVNSAEEERIQELIDTYHDQNSGETCLYDCAGHGAVSCTDGRCEAEAE